MPVAIRGPLRLHLPRIPHPPVLRLRSPVPILGQIVVPHHRRVHILIPNLHRRRRPLLVPLLIELIQLIRLQHLHEPGLHRLVAIDPQRLPGLDHRIHPIAHRTDLSRIHGHNRRIRPLPIPRIAAHPHIPRAHHRERPIRRIDLDRANRLERIAPHPHAALRQPKPYVVLRKVFERHIAQAAQTKRQVVALHLRHPILPRIQPVPRAQRVVHLRRSKCGVPIRRTRLQRDVPAQIRHTRNPIGRILILRPQPTRKARRQGKQQSQTKPRASVHDRPPAPDDDSIQRTSVTNPVFPHSASVRPPISSQTELFLRPDVSLEAESA